MEKANDSTTTHKTYRMGDSVCKLISLIKATQN